MRISHPALLLPFFAALATGCAQHSGTGVVVGSDQRGGSNANVGGLYGSPASSGPDFSQYKTFSWASQVTNLQNGVYFLNDLVFKGMVRDAVAHELAAKGYTYQPTGGDLVVNFRSFDQPTEITSNDNLGTGYWAAEEPYAYDSQRKVKLDKGSILVQLIDRKKGVEVWQGYASGLTNGDGFDKSHYKVYVAVGQIFQQYDHRGDKL